MEKIILSEKEYRDKVYGCWLGKNIGGTLGTPFEGQKYVNDLDFYHPVPTEPLANDDLDFQLVWLKVLEDKGFPPRLPDFADYWRKYLSVYPWSEYGLCMRNLERGLLPPISGWFENYYVDHMGSPIRSEIWASIAPADPERAAALAWMDSALDHAGGEGMYGEMFCAAVESAAFVLDDPLTLIRIGLAMIPGSSQISRAVREAVWCWQEGKRWAEARDRIERIYGNIRASHAPINHAFIVLGWLYGEDFGDKLCKAVNCGYDTDCTGATLGALLGIIGGTAYIPDKWVKPVGKGIILHPYTGKFNAPETVDELTERTVVQARRFAKEQSDTVGFGNETSLPTDLSSLLFRNEKAVAAYQQDTRAAVALDGDLDITFHYQGDPVLYPSVSRRVTVSLSKKGQPVAGKVALRAPAGWKVEKAGENATFDVTASEVKDNNVIKVEVELEGKSYSAGFTVLGPNVAKGYPSATGVETCRKCGGRKGDCLCPAGST